METVDPDITATCKDLGAVKKVFQLALLCTKRQPADRPTMHEVARVLGSLVPSASPPKQLAPPPAFHSSAKVPCYMDEYANLKTPHLVNCPSMSTSDAQLFLKFGEVISQNSEWKKCQFFQRIKEWCCISKKEKKMNDWKGWELKLCIKNFSVSYLILALWTAMMYNLAVIFKNVS